MFYEAVDRNQVHAIGLAWSDDGLRWEKDRQCGPDPGGPILRPRSNEVRIPNLGSFKKDQFVGDTHWVKVEQGFDSKDCRRSKRVVRS